MNLESANAVSIATSVRDRKITAVSVTQAALQRIAARNQQLNCFTNILADIAIQDAARIDSEGDTS